MRFALWLFLGLVLGIAMYYFYPYRKLPEGIKADRLVVYKNRRVMQLWSGGNVLQEYPVALGWSPVGHKTREGDGKTPEGVYYIDSKNPHSGYFLNLGVSYPNKVDRQKAEKLGLKPGGDIKIHGLKNGSSYIGRFQRWRDWTNGCIALTDQEMKELYDHVRIGTPIEIYP